jgi:hypothetical protein
MESRTAPRACAVRRVQNNRQESDYERPGHHRGRRTLVGDERRGGSDTGAPADDRPAASRRIVAIVNPATLGNAAAAPWSTWITTTGNGPGPFLFASGGAMRSRRFPVWKRAVAAVIVIPFLVALPLNGTRASRGASSPRATASSGCGTTVQTGSRRLTGAIDGHHRTGIIHIPTGYRKSHPVALVLNLHGSGSTAAAQEGFSRMDATADRDTFIVAYPQALIPAGTGYDWNIPHVPLFGGAPVPPGAANDVTFLTQLVHTLEGRYCIRTTAVYATGVSGGGRMASQLACDASRLFAAVAPVVGLRRPRPARPPAPCP